VKLVQVLEGSRRMKIPTSIRALFSLPGFVAASRLVGFFGDRDARVLVLRHRKHCALLVACAPLPRPVDQRTCRA